MKKRLFILGLILLLVAANSTMIFATNFSRKGDNSIGDALVNQGYELTTKSFKFSNGNIMVDVTPVGEKSTQAVSINGKLSTMAAPTYNSEVDIVERLLSPYRVVAKSSSTYFIDYIYVKARAYDENGKLTDSGSDSDTNSSYVATFADAKWHKVTGYGNHTYKHTGYKDVVHETKISNL